MDWTDSRDRLLHIRDLLADMRTAARDGAVVIVEGQRDEQALRRLGVHGTYARASQAGKPLADVAGEIHGRGAPAVMALDWDGHGARLEVRLHELLQRFGVPVDRRTRIRLGALVRKDIDDVESLPRLLRNLRRDAGIPPGTGPAGGGDEGPRDPVHLG